MPSINFNQSAMVALDTLRDINMSLEKTQNIISTGKDVSNARDNAAVWAISKVMESDVASFEAITDSLNLGAATVGVARSASEQITELLKEMKTLIVSSQEENVDRGKIDQDVQDLIAQIDSIVGAAQFNGQNLLQGTGSIDVLASLDRDTSGAVTDKQITVSRQSLETSAEAFGNGGNVTGVADVASATITDTNSVTMTIAAGTTIAAGDSFRFTLDGNNYDYVARTGDDANSVAQALASVVTTGTAAVGDSFNTVVTTSSDPANNAVTLEVINNQGVDATIAFDAQTGGTVGGGLSDLDGLNVLDKTASDDALSKIEGLIQTAISSSASFGSAQNRISIQTDFVQSLVGSLEAGISALTDANLEEASARLQSLQVQQQLNIQALTIANQSPQAILALFR